MVSLPQYFRYKGSPPTNYSSFQKTKTNNLFAVQECGLILFFRRNARVWQTNGQTGGTDSYLMAIPCIALHAVAR